MTKFPILAAAAFLAGCNTMHGIGQDVGLAGRSLTGESKAAASPAPQSTQQTVAVNTDTIKQVQTSLHDQRFYNGPIDGHYGPETGTAISKYQASKGRPATGALDSATLNELGHQP